MIPILRPPPRPTARVFLRDHEVALVERRAALWRGTLAALCPPRNDADRAALEASARLQALARVVDLPASVLFGEAIELRVVPDEHPLPGVALADAKGKTLPGSGRFERVKAPIIVCL